MDSLEQALLRTNLLEKELKEVVEQELVMLRDSDKDIKVQLFNGFAVYSLGDSDFALATVHNGSYVPEGVGLKQSSEERKEEEDLFTGELYLPLFLENGGIWITSHLSRYFVDLNRPKEKAILCYGSDSSGSNLKSGDEQSIMNFANQFYNSFYTTSEEAVSNKFLFSGHSMNDKKGRGDFCLIYRTELEGIELKESLERQGFENIGINNPFIYEGGHFRTCFDIISRESVEFEINKRLYMCEEKHEKLSTFDDVSQRVYFAVDGVFK